MPKNTTLDNGKTTRILIVDDHPVVREGLSALIAAQRGLSVCGQAAGIAEALHLVESTSPDLIIIDISLKDGNGIELIKRLKARNSAVPALVSSMHDEDLYAERALRAGAVGYISKQESSQRIIEAIRRVLEGKIYLSERMSERLLHGFVAGSIQRSPVETLADRELQVFELIGQGLNSRQIAAQLHLGTKTVETYRARIREKLSLSGGGDLTRFAIHWAMQAGQKASPT